MKGLFNTTFDNYPRDMEFSDLMDDRWALFRQTVAIRSGASDRRLERLGSISVSLLEP